ncbi:hypothetical protein C8Q78DRAFT_801151 [Trametes maxima]|nr:hypothetical protein C8Q78DRAFT_801151 [Trametes maxima]
MIRLANSTSVVPTPHGQPQPSKPTLMVSKMNTSLATKDSLVHMDRNVPLVDPKPRPREVRTTDVGAQSSPMTPPSVIAVGSLYRTRAPSAQPPRKLPPEGSRNGFCRWVSSLSNPPQFLSPPTSAHIPPEVRRCEPPFLLSLSVASRTCCQLRCMSLSITSTSFVIFQVGGDRVCRPHGLRLSGSDVAISPTESNKREENDTVLSRFRCFRSSEVMNVAHELPRIASSCPTYGACAMNSDSLPLVDYLR